MRLAVQFRILCNRLYSILEHARTGAAVLPTDAGRAIPESSGDNKRESLLFAFRLKHFLALYKRL